MTKLAEVQAAAFRLTVREKFSLADALLGSLPNLTPAATADEILAEAIRRDSEIGPDKTPTLSEDAFWAGLRRKQA